MHTGTREDGPQKAAGPPRCVTRISREAERRFFFYATVVMFLVWAGTKLFGAAG